MLRAVLQLMLWNITLSTPSISHPLQVLRDVLVKLNITHSVGADHDGYPWIFGYRGPSLSELGYKVMRVISFIEDMMMIKSPAELALLRESAKWGISPIACCSSIRALVPPKLKSAFARATRRHW